MTVPPRQIEPHPSLTEPLSTSVRSTHDAPPANTPANMSDDLLRWLLRFPLLRVEELAFLSDISRSRAYARLSRLQDQALVACWRAPVLAGAGTHLYALTAPGVAALTATYGATAWRLARQWQADEYGVQCLLLRAPTLVMTQSVVVSLLAGAPQTLRPGPAHRTDASAGCGPTHVEWSWMRHYPLRFLYRSRSGCVRLDAYVRFTVDMPHHRDDRDRRDLSLIHI